MTKTKENTESKQVVRSFRCGQNVQISVEHLKVRKQTEKGERKEDIDRETM